MKLKPIVLALSFATLVLSACAGTRQGEPMTWGYAGPSGPEGPKLAFGVDETDYLAVVFLCDPSADSVQFDVPIGDRQDASAVKLRSGGISRRYEPFVPKEIDGYEVAHFKTGRADLVLSAFAKSGRLSIDVYGTFVSHDVKTSAERDAVAKFVKACGLRLS